MPWRGSSESKTSNSAEGFKRGGNRDFLQFVSDAKGSCGEVRDQRYTALDEKDISREQFRERLTCAPEVSQLIGGFMKYLQPSEVRAPKFQQCANTERL